MITSNDSYIAAYERGSVDNALPLWASGEENPLSLNKLHPQPVEHNDVEGVPGVFQLLNVLSEHECQRFITATENMGYTEDAAVSLGRNIRHNMNLNWIIDDTSERIIWSRIAPLLASLSDDNPALFLNEQPLGLNQRFRFYRYKEGDFFSFHTDGAWPGSKIIDRKSVADAFGDRFSLFTCLIFLSDDFEGGATEFLVDKDDASKPARRPNNAILKGVRTPAGGLLCFPHGNHPLHCMHASGEITGGTKHIIRTDILFSL